MTRVTQMSGIRWLMVLVGITVPLIVSGAQVQIPSSEVIDAVDTVSGRTYPLFVKLPRSYKANPTKYYPVIYITDAPYAFQIASGVTRLMMNSKAMKEAIIVGISYAKNDKGAASRVRDFTISKAKSWEMTTGQAEQHAAFISTTVIPLIERSYRVDASERTYIGNSLGGLFGAYLLFKHPDMFSHYILGSPSVWFNDNALLTLSVIQPEKATRVYIGVGSLEQPSYGEGQDMIEGATSLADKIQRDSGANVALQVKIIDGAKHVTAFPTTLAQGLDWLYSK